MHATRRAALLAALVFMLFVLAGHPAEAAHEAARLPEAEEGPEGPPWMKRVRLTGIFEGDFVWREHGDVAEKGSESSSDLLVSTVELGVEADFVDWIQGFALLLAEDLGTEEAAGVTFDEVILTLDFPRTPFYATMGKRALPFGVFENPLVSDPMTQDAYEVNQVGLTAGYTGPWHLDLSFTAYKGEELMDHLFDSGLLDTGRIRRAGDGSDAVESFIASAMLSPLKEHVILFGGFLSEPGSDRRNQTVDVGASLIPPDVPLLGNLKLDAEYMKALSRETYAGLDGQFREGVLSVTLSYRFILREIRSIGSSLYRERREFILTQPVVLAVRYEHFDDDGLVEAARAWAVRDRMSAGGHYSFYEDGSISAYVEAEYRMTGIKVHPSLRDAVEDENRELFLRLGLTF
ncbi:MAG: hypothetical protein P8Y75_11615 [Nitrospirota bacterium]